MRSTLLLLALALPLVAGCRDAIVDVTPDPVAPGADIEVITLKGPITLPYGTSGAYRGGPVAGVNVTEYRWQYSPLAFDSPAETNTGRDVTLIARERGVYLISVTAHVGAQLIARGQREVRVY